MPVARRDLLGIASVAFAGSARADASVPCRTRPAEGPVPARLLPPGGESRFVTANGIRMHYVIAGSGPAVLLLHGWPETWFAWAGTIRALSNRFTLIAPDLRGIGLSERPMAGYDKRTIAADLSDLIGRVAGGRAYVVAHDMGGKAAYVLARTQPERIGSSSCSTA